MTFDSHLNHRTKEAEQSQPTRNSVLGMTYHEMSEVSDEAAAYHEAGHATAASVLSHARAVTEVTLDSELDGFRAHCAQEPFEQFLQPGGSIPTSEEFRAMVRADIAVTMAGPYAERRFANEPGRDHDGIVSDFLKAQELADEFLFAPEAAVQGEAAAVAQQLVADYWPAISAVATGLLERRALLGDELRDIIRQASALPAGHDGS